MFAALPRAEVGRRCECPETVRRTKQAATWKQVGQHLSPLERGDSHVSTWGDLNKWAYEESCAEDEAKPMRGFLGWWVGLRVWFIRVRKARHAYPRLAWLISFGRLG